MVACDIRGACGCSADRCERYVVRGLSTVGTRSWDNLLNRPGENPEEALFLDKKKQFQEKCLSPKVALAVFSLQDEENWQSFFLSSNFWFLPCSNPEYKRADMHCVLDGLRLIYFWRIDSIGLAVMIGSAWRCTTFQVPSSGRKIVVSRRANGAISCLAPNLALPRCTSTR